MKTNEEIIKVHDALVSKAAARCALDGNNKAAVEIGNEIIAYGKLWLESFANDGRIDEDEAKLIKDGFKYLVDKRVKDVEFGRISLVNLAYTLFLKGKIEKALGIEY